MKHTHGSTGLFQYGGENSGKPRRPFGFAQDKRKEREEKLSPQSTQRKGGDERIALSQPAYGSIRKVLAASVNPLGQAGAGGESNTVT